MNPRWINASILAGAGCFIFALIVSAVFDPSIRVLHVLQTLMYVVVIVWTRRNNAWAFGAGCMISAFWNYINLFVTNFVELVCNNSRNCFERVNSTDPIC